MISPSARLVFVSAALLVPLSLLVAAGMVGLTAAAVLTGMLVVAALYDAAVSMRSMSGIEASFEPLTRLTRDRPAEIVIEIRNEEMKARDLKLGLILPDRITSDYSEMSTRLPPEAELSRVAWSVTAVERGNYHLKNIYMQSPSRVGLWDMRKTSASRGEVRVYPNTMVEKKGLAAVFLNRGMVGIHSQRQVGKGREFEKLREYMPGDSYDDIHWKATAKRGHPVTKVYQLERTQEVYVVIDSSRLSGRAVDMSAFTDVGEAPTTQLERFITSAMVLGMVAERQGDLFGVIAFDDKVKRFVRAKNGKEHYGTCREALYALEPSDTNPDFSEVCSFIRLKLRKRALLIFLTNLDDPVLAESFTRNLDLIGRHHLVLVNMLTTPGVSPVFSEPDVTRLDELYERLGGHLMWRELSELKRSLSRNGVSMNMIDNERMGPEIISQYVNVKRRQLI